MEVAPLPAILLCLSSVLLCLWLGLVFLILSIFSLSFVRWVGDTLSYILLCGVPRPKLPRLLFEILLNFDGISVACTQGRDIQKLHFGMDVSMNSTAII